MRTADRYERRRAGRRVFVKSMILTAAAILLILIGFFTAGFLDGGI